MSIYQIVVDEYGWARGGHRGVAKYYIEPTMPADPFSYVLTKYDYEAKQVITGEPYITESIAALAVPLATAVFPETVSRDRHYGPGSRRVPQPVKEIRVSARVRVLRYGGDLFLYGGLIDQNPPSELPLEVLEWKLAFEYGSIRYESGKNAYRRTIECGVNVVPSAYDVCVSEGVPWPQEPYLGIGLERFFFRRWLQNRTLTLEDARPLYEADVLAPHRQAVAQYQANLAECEKYYSQWLERHGVLLLTVEEIGEYLRDKALPEAARRVKERARRVLEEAGHPEFLPVNGEEEEGGL